MSTVNEILKEALRDFREAQPPMLYQKFQDTSAKDVKSYILAMQASQDRVKALRDLARIRSFIVAFDTFQKTARLTDEQTACIWGPIRYILQNAKDEPDAFEDVLHSYRDLGSRVPTMDPYNDMVTEKVEAKRCLAYMYEDFLQFQKRMLSLLSGHGWKATFHINWKDSQEAFSTVLKTFELYAQTLQRMLETHRYQTSNDVLRRINDHTQAYQDDRRSLDTHIRQYEEDRAKLLCSAKAQEEARKAQQLTAVRKWIAAPTHLQAQLHDSFREIRLEFKGTTDWIVNNVNICNWVSTELPPHAILWINGKKGAGKTILASRLIEYCEEARPDYKTSYFYCREDDPNQNTCLAIYKSLLNQMLSHHRDMLPSCDDKRLKGSAEILSDENTARQLMERFCDAELNQFIIIDGLDEIHPIQRKLLVNQLSSMVDRCDRYNPGKLRILLVSHDLPDIGRLKCMETATILSLDPKDTKKSIKMFVDIKLLEINEKFHLNAEDLESAKSKTVKQSDGMFLYASLVMDNILNQPSVYYLKEQLEDNFPETLEDAYKRIIDRLHRHSSRNQWSMAKKVFGWLACAKRPLNWHEIQAALSIIVDDRGRLLNMDFYNRVLREDPHRLCGSLVQKLGNRIVFTHQTVRQYIVQSQELDERSIECDLAIICLSYLVSPWFRKDLRQDERSKFVRKGYLSFQDYALSKWDHHLKAFIQTGASFLQGGIGNEQYRKISETLRRFADVYRDDLSASIPENEERDSNLAEECSEFRGHDFYPDLIVIWKHIHVRQGCDSKQRNKVGIATLETALKENRKKLEELALSETSEAANVLEERYGSHVFKCDRLLCDWFYEGFSNADARDNHLRRHDRPFKCPVQDCSVVRFGFSTNKDREKHVKMYHPDEAAAAGFVQLPREYIEDARFSCPDCGKFFTRKANRDAHVRSHYGERPFECPSCERAFTRVNDLRRHERNKHVRRRG